MKKTLLTALLGVGLVFGSGNEVKGQTSASDWEKNNYKLLGCYFPSDFQRWENYPSERIVGYMSEGGGYEGITSGKSLGMSDIFYFDYDKNGFYETIKIFNYDQSKERLIKEEIKINENTGLIDYAYKKYINVEWGGASESVGGKIINMYKTNWDNYASLEERKYYTDLTEEEVYNISPEFRNRVKNLIKSSESEERLKNMLEQERFFWKNKD